MYTVYFHFYTKSRRVYTHELRKWIIKLNHTRIIHDVQLYTLIVYTVYSISVHIPYTRYTHLLCIRYTRYYYFWFRQEIILSVIQYVIPLVCNNLYTKFEIFIFFDNCNLDIALTVIEVFQYSFLLGSASLLMFIILLLN